MRAATAGPWFDGQTEGQVTGLELVERRMYGRGEIDTPRAGTVQAG